MDSSVLQPGGIDACSPMSAGGGGGGPQSGPGTLATSRPCRFGGRVLVRPGLGREVAQLRWRLDREIQAAEAQSQQRSGAAPSRQQPATGPSELVVSVEPAAGGPAVCRATLPAEHSWDDPAAVCARLSRKLARELLTHRGRPREVRLRRPPPQPFGVTCRGDECFVSGPISQGVERAGVWKGALVAAVNGQPFRHEAPETAAKALASAASAGDVLLLLCDATVRDVSVVLTPDNRVAVTALLPSRGGLCLVVRASGPRPYIFGFKRGCAHRSTPQADRLEGELAVASARCRLRWRPRPRSAQPPAAPVLGSPPAGSRSPPDSPQRSPSPRRAPAPSPSPSPTKPVGDLGSPGSAPQSAPRRPLRVAIPSLDADGPGGATCLVSPSSKAPSGLLMSPRGTVEASQQRLRQLMRGPPQDQGEERQVLCLSLRFAPVHPVSFADALPGTVVAMTPAGFAAGRDIYAGTVAQRDERCVTVRWNEPTSGGPPEYAPRTSREPQEWWDGPGRPRTNAASPCIPCDFASVFSNPSNAFRFVSDVVQGLRERVERAYVQDFSVRMLRATGEPPHALEKLNPAAVAAGVSRRVRPRPAQSPNRNAQTFGGAPRPVTIWQNELEELCQIGNPGPNRSLFASHGDVSCSLFAAADSSGPQSPAAQPRRAAPPPGPPRRKVPPGGNWGIRADLLLDLAPGTVAAAQKALDELAPGHGDGVGRSPARAWLGGFEVRDACCAAAQTGSGYSSKLELTVGGLSAARRRRLGVVIHSDALKRTEIRQEDVLQVRRIFEEIDVDKSGFLTLKELISFSVANPRAIPNLVFKNLVTDDDGLVYFEELLRCHFPKCSAAAVKEAIEKWAPRGEVDDFDDLEEESIAEIRQIFRAFRPGFVADHTVFESGDNATAGRPKNRMPPPQEDEELHELDVPELTQQLNRSGLSEDDIRGFFAAADKDQGGSLGEMEFVLLLKEYFVNQQRGIGLYGQAQKHNIRWCKIFPAVSGSKTGGPEDYFKAPYFWDVQ